MMQTNRREFLKAGAAFAAVAALPRPLVAYIGRKPEPVPPIQDPRLQPLAQRALDAARSAGAGYADIRLTHTRQRVVRPGPGPNLVADSEDMEVGVRALVNGYWGFASGPVWSPDEMARLGGEAVYQARRNAMAGEPRRVDLAPLPSVPSGHWVMPVQRDPFGVSPYEIQDYLAGLSLAANEIPGLAIGTDAAHFAMSQLDANFWTQERAFASTDGSYCTQQLFRTSADALLDLKYDRRGEEQRGVGALSPAGLGWELFTADRIPQVRDHPLREEIRRLAEMMKASLTLPIQPVDVGRYDAAFDASTVQNLAAETLGRATELDRALGYEANAGGTSYIDDPTGMLGSYQAGVTALTLTGSRSTPGGAATVQWDDEGVAPDECVLVKDGVLQDFQTNREGAGWLKDAYARLGRPFRSHGFTNAPSAMDPPMEHVPNLDMAPGAGTADFEELIGGLSNGIAIEGVSPSMDFQHVTGMGMGLIYRVKKGQRTARLAEAGFLFNAPELWKSLAALGGPASVRRYGRLEGKGEPKQQCYYSVSAPPAVAKQLALVNPLRKA